MRSGRFRSILVSAIALGCGLPLYLLLDRMHLLSPSLRQTPWPLAVPALGAVAAFVVARRKPGVAVSAAALGSVALLAAAAAHARRPLPPPPHEISVGAKLPLPILRDEHGRTVALQSLLRDRPAVLLLFRGVWCPSCRRQLAALSAEADRFLAAGVAVYGITPDPPDVVAKWSPSLHAPFPILSNENSQIANDVCGGDSHCQLIVDPSGTIRWGSLNDNWRTLTPPDAVLQSAWRLR
jgi:peroxiredoxin